METDVVRNGAEAEGSHVNLPPYVVYIVLASNTIMEPGSSFCS